MKQKIINFKNIKFYNTDFSKILQKIKEGGYLVAPAASSLSKINKNKKYYEALVKSNVAILDSGFFCILLRAFKGLKVKKFSGYLFLKNFLNIKFTKNTRFLIIDPNFKESKHNLAYLNKKNIFNIKAYIAPQYNKNINDKNLLKIINKYKPRYILINIGGEVQEILALYIREKINFKISILCTGAAIAFLTKQQAPINSLIDSLYLGWFVRLIYNPRKYFFRILGSLKLIRLF